MPVLYSNNASATLASSITNIATSLTVATGKGALFPSISGGDYFYVTLTDASGNIEIVKVTAVSTDTFTVTRAQDGTTARAWSTGDTVELRVARVMLNDLKTERLALAGGTMTGQLILPASTTTAAPFNIGVGSAPTSPVTGDVWGTTSGLFYRISGATYQFATLSTSGQLFSGSQNFSGVMNTSTTLTIQSTATNQLFTLGGPSQTGVITIGQSTVNSATNVQIGATASGSTKSINIGTGGLSGSTTSIAIGSAVSGSTTNVAANGQWTFSGNIKENVFTITDGASVDVNPANGSIQLWTLGASRTPTASSFAAGQSVTLMVTAGANAITWTDTSFGSGGVKWVSSAVPGSAPTLSTTAVSIIELWKTGSQVYGAFVGVA